MKLIFIIAWRNIFRHKTKSLIIGVILFLGSLLMTVGNGVISGMDRGIEHNIIEGFLGDAVILSDKQKSDSILFDMTGSMLEQINNFPQIKALLQSQPYVDRFLPVGKNMAMALSDDVNAMPNYVYLLGVEFASYQKMFPHSLTTVEGRLMQPGEKGLLMPAFSREQFYSYTNYWSLPEGGKLIKENLSQDAKENLSDLQLSENAVLMGMSEDNTSTDLRFKIKGIIKYRTLNTIFGHFNITDIESYRECMGYFSAHSKTVEVAKEDQTLLNLDSQDLDSMFGSEDLLVSNHRKAVPTSKALAQESSAPVDLEAGAFNLVFIKFKPKTNPTKAIKDLNLLLKNAKTNTRVTSWKNASGVIGSLTTIIKGALLLFVGFLFLVAIIIIINTLTMSAMERTSEIGMMRAIGAHKRFIRWMFLGEIGTLAAVFGGAGLLLGLIIVNIIPLFNITTTNDFLQLLYGGDVFHPLLQFSDLFVTMLELVGVTLLAAIYPIKIASGITPLDAIARD